jgi:RNA-dependent RNA polymerase
MLTIDVLRSSCLKTPGRLSSQTIINLAENGVPHCVFVEIFRASLRELVDGLTKWDGPNAMYELWLNVARAGGVMASRRAREASGEARVKGYGDYENNMDMEGDDDDLEPFDAALHQRPAAWWTDQISGCPSGLEETVLVLLDSGFTPDNCAVLRDKLKQVVKTSINNYVQRYKIEIPMSCTAFVVPGM